MYKAADIRHTVAYKQLRHAAAPFGQDVLGKLVKRFLARLNEQNPFDMQFDKELDIDTAFTWGLTREGHEYWEAIQHYNEFVELNDIDPMPIKADKPKAPKAKKVEPPKRVGWWVV